MTGIDGARRRGEKARREGVPRRAVPYLDLRQRDGRGTWASAYRRAWLAGWDAEDTRLAGTPLFT